MEDGTEKGFSVQDPMIALLAILDENGPRSRRIVVR